MKLIISIFTAIIISLLLLNCNNTVNNSKKMEELKNEVKVLQNYLDKSGTDYYSELKSLDMERNYSYQDIVYLMDHIDSATLSGIDPFIEALNSKIGDDITLFIDNKPVMPVYVKFSLSKPLNHRLDYIYADDTLFFRENSLDAPIPVSTNSIFLLKEPRNIEITDGIYAGNPGQMLDNGYKVIIKLKNNNGFYQLPGNIITGEDYIIFAILKIRNFNFYIKSVWYVKAQ